MILEEELYDVLTSNNVISFECYNPDGTHRSTHSIQVSRIEHEEDSITVYGLGEESETINGVISYSEEIEGYSVTDKYGIITYISAA